MKGIEAGFRAGQEDRDLMRMSSLHPVALFALTGVAALAQSPVAPLHSPETRWQLPEVVDSPIAPTDRPPARRAIRFVENENASRQVRMIPGPESPTATNLRFVPKQTPPKRSPVVTTAGPTDQKPQQAPAGATTSAAQPPVNSQAYAAAQQDAVRMPAPPPRQTPVKTAVYAQGLEFRRTPGQERILAASHAVAAPSESVGYETSSGHVLEIGDELEIIFPYRAQFGEQTPQRLQSTLGRTFFSLVRGDGKINLPLVGTVAAAGKSVDQLEADVVAAYDEVARSYWERTKAGRREYRIAVNDTLEIKIARSNMNETVVVRPDGRISALYVDSVVAEGKTPEQLTQELRALYAKAQLEGHPEKDLVVIVRDYQATRSYVDGQAEEPPPGNLRGLRVIVRNFERRVYVSGEVRSPGAISYRRPITALQAIITAGGNKPTGRLDSIAVMRYYGAGGQPRLEHVDLKCALNGKGGQDMWLQPYDVVVVPKHAAAKVADFMEQYLYNIIPAARQSGTVQLFYNINPNVNNSNPAQGGGS